MTETTAPDSLFPVDVEALRCEIRTTYSRVAREPEMPFIFPTGRAWALELGYPEALLSRVPESACASFAGVANPFSLGWLAPGERVLDIGCGAGMDALVAAQMVGLAGAVTGLDMTVEMLERAQVSTTAMGLTNVELVEGSAEQLPFPDASFDVVISNGVIDLIPDKDAVYSQIARVLRPGGRIQIADVTIQRPVSEQAQRDIDLWTG